MAEFTSFARRLILSLDSTDGGDLIRATGYPKKLQFGAFEVHSPSHSTDPTNPSNPSKPPCVPSPPITPSSSTDQTNPSFTSSPTTTTYQTKIIAVILWGQTCDRQDHELRVTENLKGELLKLANMGEGGRMGLLGVVWRITVVEGVESSDGVGSLGVSLI